MFIFFLFDLGVACLTARLLFALHYVEKVSMWQAQSFDAAFSYCLQAAADPNRAVELPPMGNPRPGELANISGQEAQLGDMIQVPAVPTKPTFQRQESWNLTPDQEVRSFHSGSQSRSNGYLKFMPTPGVSPCFIQVPHYDPNNV